ncbi:MAG: metallophosphoesterase [Cyanophyceae cyanobacterium]
MIVNTLDRKTNSPKTHIIRGPYLQVGTDSSIIIRWATQAPVRGSVRYGTDYRQLTVTSTETVPTCNHFVPLSGLQSNRRYYYSIGAATEVAAGDPEQYFVTAPIPQSSPMRPLRVLVLGDAGRGNDIAAQVRDGYRQFTGDRHTDLWLMLGDNAYDTGTLAEYQRGVFEMYPQLLRTSVLWTAIGNHDAGSASSEEQSGPYYELFSLPTQGEAGGVPSGTAAYYSFDYGNVHFICLDSYGSDRSTPGAMLTWLAQDLAATTQDWQIAFWHHPPYTKGSHDSDWEVELIEMREQVLPILEAANVDLVLSGHSHSYERSYLLKGHYGLSVSFTESMKQDGGSGRQDESGAYDSGSGTVYIVAGTSALADPVFPHPAMYASLSVPGSLVLDVQGKHLDVTFVDASGEVGDYFTLMKDD